MIDRFAELIQALGQELGLTLHPDKHGACKLNVNDQFHIQLECDTQQEHLLIATFVCDIPPGKFRENILKDALKANASSLSGTLAYSDKNNQLALFRYLPFTNLTGHKLSDALIAFIDKAQQWKVGVETGHTASLATSAKKVQTNVPGLKP